MPAAARLILNVSTALVPAKVSVSVSVGVGALPLTSIRSTLLKSTSVTPGTLIWPPPATPEELTVMFSVTPLTPL